MVSELETGVGYWFGISACDPVGNCSAPAFPGIQPTTTVIEHDPDPGDVVINELMWTGLEGKNVDDLMDLARAKGTGNPPKKKYKYKCSWTGKEFSIPVKLDRSRPIYCEEGKEIVREAKKTGAYDARKDLIYDENLEPIGSVAELGTDGLWALKNEEGDIIGRKDEAAVKRDRQAARDTEKKEMAEKIAKVKEEMGVVEEPKPTALPKPGVSLDVLKASPAGDQRKKRKRSHKGKPEGASNPVSTPHDRPLTVSSEPKPTPTPTPKASPSPTATATSTPLPSPTPAEGTGVIYGFVLDENEFAFKNVSVTLTYANGYSKNAKTDSEGYYEFANLAAGDYTLTYSKDGYQTQTQDISLEEDESLDIGAITMEPVEKGMISGYVVDIRGDPIEYAKLKLKGIKIKKTTTAVSDADGFFEFTGLDADDYIITAKKSRYKSTRKTIQLEEGDEVEVEIEMKKTSRRGVMVLDP